MFNLKIIFYTVLLLFDVFFTASGFDDANQGSINSPETNGYTTCINEMSKVFGADVKPVYNKFINPISCVKRAINKFKLHGDNATEYEPHVKLYYERFHLFVDFETILKPGEFCAKEYGDGKSYCYTQIQDIENDKRFYLLLPNYSCYDGREGSTSEALSLEEHVEKQKVWRFKLRVFFNALYFFKSVESEENISTHYPKSSYGQRYLADVARKIKLKLGLVSNKRMRDPQAFCKDLYPDQELLYNPRTFAE